ncbi:MFS transporter [Kribbella albertanoniae]|uniref:DHA2 family efflux MFS transporter permease subunit n=1 Tax=Kribbella albertanoniae TaxID=1266829 RepID=A0A4R4QEI7_9ACTN|nr:MFS transporter [Kribbella albertanoniae]TDC33996.1 DHA2 family efflux MFS transporter permease subunit [Kribbella albertanoniae]
MSRDVIRADPPERRPPDMVAESPRHGHRNLGLALAVISVAQLMMVLDGTVVNIALPHIQKDLGFSNESLTWVITAYTLAFGGLLLLGGRIGDVIGRRKVFTFGVALFGVASFLGGIAQNETLLLASRILQGVGAAATSPNALALITTTFPAGKERNRAMGVYAAISGAGAAIGLILGGLLTEASWRWTFFINTPIGLIVALLAIRYLGESDRQHGKFDLWGAATATLGLTALVYGLTNAAREGWGDPATVALIAGGLALIAVFLVIEARSRHALMPLRILANRTRGVSFLAMLTVGAAMFAMFYFLCLFVQNVMGYSALKTGFAFLPFSVGIIVAAQVASTLIARIDPRWIAGGGSILMATGLFGFSRLEVDSVYLTFLLPTILVMAFGMGLIWVTLTLTAVSGVANEDSGVGSAVFNTVQQIGGAVGLALLGSISTNAIRDKFTELGPGLAQATQASPDQAQQLQAQATAVATTHGFTTAFLVSAYIALGAAVITLIGLSVKHKELGRV